MNPGSGALDLPKDQVLPTTLFFESLNLFVVTVERKNVEDKSGCLGYSY